MPSILPQTGPVDLTKGAWEFQYSPTCPAFFDFIQGFTLPNRNPDLPLRQNGLHYVTKQTGSINAKEITFSLEVTGDGRAIPTEGGSEAKATLFLQRAGDDLSADKPWHRFWSHEHRLPLVPGIHTVTVPLSSGAWTGVFGTSYAEGFAQCLANLGRIGWTCGGDFFGHGVYAEGELNLRLLTYRIF